MRKSNFVNILCNITKVETIQKERKFCLCFKIEAKLLSFIESTELIFGNSMLSLQRGCHDNQFLNLIKKKYAYIL